MESKGCQIEISKETANDEEDLRQDFVSVETSCVARLYGWRRSKRKTDQVIRTLEDENS